MAAAVAEVEVEPVGQSPKGAPKADGGLNVNELLQIADDHPPIDQEQKVRLRSTAPAPIAHSDGDGNASASPSESSNRSETKLKQRRRLYIASHGDDFPHEAEFNANLSEARAAIRHGVYPELIPAGSSGSYFVRNADGRMLAVFKPKDEEPFASLNPKWPKFFQRVLCFCCFGRACLIPNNGYLSETAASIFNIVPKTRVVKLCSPTFSYNRICGRRIEPRPKEGSYQLFVHGYRSAADLFPEWNNVGINNVLNEQEVEIFTVLFQKMAALDYVIRNTDRHMDNWLIKHVPGVELKVAAIDNGLAFPVKHPESASRFRQFPFNWAALVWAKKPWNPQLSEYLLNLITPAFLHRMCSELKTLFCHGVSNRQLVAKQLRVFRGQMWNLVESLRAGESPYDLVKRRPVLVTRKHGNMAPTNLNWNEASTPFLPSK
ncbi:Phosphatidylinositol 4-kinase type 2 [Aphelenchoides fujianensis]|nr:Phosphatidylinositol 4-kinase type 2 [Aphelenchoides fujianensis]